MGNGCVWGRGIGSGSKPVSKRSQQANGMSFRMRRCCVIFIILITTIMIWIVQGARQPGVCWKVPWSGWPFFPMSGKHPAIPGCGLSCGGGLLHQIAFPGDMAPLPCQSQTVLFRAGWLFRVWVRIQAPFILDRPICFNDRFLFIIYIIR